MKRMEYLQEKAPFLMCMGCLILFLGVSLKGLKVPTQLNILVCTTACAITVLAVLLDCRKRRKYHKDILELLESMDQPQYIAPLMPKVELPEAEVLENVIAQTTKAMNDEIASYKQETEAYKEYIEAWVHEIKVPMAGIALICENNKNAYTNEIAMEMEKVDRAVEQVLYYARSSQVSKDYRVQKVNVDVCLKNVLKRNAKQLIAVGCKIELEESGLWVLSDAKWLEFMLDQMIQNALKYRKEEFTLELGAKIQGEHVAIYIKDNGIGIPQRDIRRVFEKGFTGTNGRKYAKSTGMGLYLCDTLCRKMNHKLTIESEEMVGTTLQILCQRI